jgi:nitrate reductase assembly molybdenum cofactor insertion protein NarJ
MRASIELHDRTAELLEYPSGGRSGAVAAAAERLAADLPALRAALAPLIALAESGGPGALEESYAAAFDNTDARALEVGWHAFGENYTRGAFLVRMRERLRACGVPETTELPDHLSHVLRVLGRSSEHEARVLSQGIVLPAVEKVLAALPAESAWRGAVEAAALVLRSHLALGEPAHV